MWIIIATIVSIVKMYDIVDYVEMCFAISMICYTVEVVLHFFYVLAHYAD